MAQLVLIWDSQEGHLCAAFTDVPALDITLVDYDGESADPLRVRAPTLDGRVHPWVAMSPALAAVIADPAAAAAAACLVTELAAAGT